MTLQNFDHVNRQVITYIEMKLQNFDHINRPVITYIEVENTVK